MVTDAAGAGSGWSTFMQYRYDTNIHAHWFRLKWLDDCFFCEAIVCAPKKDRCSMPERPSAARVIRKYDVALFRCGCEAVFQGGGFIHKFFIEIRFVPTGNRSVALAASCFAGV